MQILKTLQNRFAKALPPEVESPEKFTSMVTGARDPQHGDYQANLAMPLKSVLGKPPRQIAEEIVANLEISDLCLAPEIAGPGFINLRLLDDVIADQIQRLLHDERLNVSLAESKTYVIDYSSPNVAKPMHVGHIRSTVIGDSLARTLRFLGHQVITDNHLGDWGTQFGMIIYGYKHFLNASDYEENPVGELSRIYRLVRSLADYQAAKAKVASLRVASETADSRVAELEAQPSDSKHKKALKTARRDQRSAAEELLAVESKIASIESSETLSSLATEHAAIEKLAQLETAKLHSGDEENLKLWNQFMPVSKREIDQIYERLDIVFDHTLGESFYQPMLSQVVEDLKQKGLAVESDGAECIFLDGFDAPMLIQKSDGAFLYATTDLATIDYRVKTFSPDTCLYVVDHRQGEHFAKLFAASKAIGHESLDLVHVSFGTVLDKNGKPFKTRAGDVVGLGYLLDEAVQNAYQAVCQPERLEKAGMELSEEEKRHIATVVGLGAIKYADLSHNRTSDYVFDTAKMVQLEGNTSTYIQYMTARTKGILRKAEVSLEVASGYDIQLNSAAERSLALCLLQFEDALLATADEYMPNLLTNYLFATAKQFATFFDQCPVISAETEQLKQSRLALCAATQRVLVQGLSLLGIGVVDRM